VHVDRRAGAQGRAAPAGSQWTVVEDYRAKGLLIRVVKWALMKTLMK
jgi:hypothetical protein